MNQFTLLVIILVVFTYYGGSNVPKVLKDNKELLLGVVGGLVLCSFLGMRLEGITGGNDDCVELGWGAGHRGRFSSQEMCENAEMVRVLARDGRVGPPAVWRIGSDGEGKCCEP